MKNQKPIQDIYCVMILFSIASQTEIRFNDLLKHLNEQMKVSPPTLSNHLKHLIKQKLIIRTVEEAQNVTYRINNKGFRNFPELTKVLKDSIATWKVTKEQFGNLSVAEHLNDFVRTNMLVNLECLKSRILWEAYKNIERWFILNFLSSPYLKIKEQLIIQKSLKDKEYRDKVIQEIEFFQKKLTEEI